MSNESSALLIQEYLKNAILEVIETFPTEFVFEPSSGDKRGFPNKCSDKIATIGSGTLGEDSENQCQ